MEIKNYAPVLIPTLYRYEHFKRSLESLERCTGSEHTDVYVALDYPAKNSHVEGWKIIDAFLREKEKKNGFKNLIVRRRDHNCGVFKTGGNAYLLIQEVSKITDKYIFSEDDNEFSPCFLEYINKALEKYKDDERIISVCGYSPFDYSGGKNIYFARTGNGWGYGVWVKKRDEIMSFVNLKNYEEILNNSGISMKIFLKFPTSLYCMMDNVLEHQIYGDIGHQIYCKVFDRYSLFPSRSLVRNWGNDGSGVHDKSADNTKYILAHISDEKTFELDDIVVSEQKKVRKLLKKVETKHWYGNIAILLRYFIWRLTNKDLFSLLKKVGLMYSGKS